MIHSSQQPKVRPPRSLSEVSLREAPALLMRKVRGLSSQEGLTWLACVPLALFGLATSVMAQFQARYAVQRFDERYCVVKHQSSS